MHSDNPVYALVENGPRRMVLGGACYVPKFDEEGAMGGGIGAPREPNVTGTVLQVLQTGREVEVRLFFLLTDPLQMHNIILL